jgi:hypothetical protein
MYNLIELGTGAIIESYDNPPTSIPSGTFLVQDTPPPKEAATNRINELAKEEISLGYIDENGVLFGLSETDQLNYTSMSSLVNMGAEQIVVIGETADDKYYEVVFSSAEAKEFFASIFSHVESILSKYRGYKRQILEEDTDFSDIVTSAEQSLEAVKEEHASKIG